MQLSKSKSSVYNNSTQTLKSGTIKYTGTYHTPLGQGLLLTRPGEMKVPRTGSPLPALQLLAPIFISVFVFMPRNEHQGVTIIA